MRKKLKCIYTLRCGTIERQNIFNAKISTANIFNAKISQSMVAGTYELPR